MKKTRTRTLPAPRIALIALVWLSLFAYAGRPILAGAAAAGLAPLVAWALVLAAAALPALPLFLSKGHAPGYTTLALFSTLFVLVLIGDVVRGIYTLARWVLAAPHWPLLDARALSLTLLGTAVVLSGVGLVQARCPRIRRVRVPIENLPAELEGYRIVQWSDVHVGPTIRRPFLESLVARTNALDADALVITGDFVDGPLAMHRDDVTPLRDVRTRDGAFYVTGNHEYYWRASEWVPHLEAHGLTFLKNAHAVITRGDARLVMAGVTDPVGRDTHRQDPDKALAAAPAGAIKILLSHRPQTASAASRLGVHLQLSGHTHGGQFFPFNLFIKRFQPIAKGLHRVGRTWLYVNRGTGYWGPPSRLFVGGELTVITLQRC